MRRINLLHPFSAKAIGLKENDLLFSHSKPHERALGMLNFDEFDVSIDYFTGKILPYSENIEGIKKRFWPITKPLLKGKHKWRKQHSLWHFLGMIFKPVDFTIINMSGFGSSYVFKLAKVLTSKKKPYAAMIGGVNMSKTVNELEYYQNAHHIIVHTSIQKKELEVCKGFENLDIRVMPLGVDTNQFKPLSFKKTEDIELLFVGRITRLKQIELAIKALYLLKKSLEKHVELTIIGPKSDMNYYNELITLIKDLRLNENVVFFSSMDQKDLVPYFQKANLLLLPSAHESFGMVMIEAMACGTSVAAIEGAGGPDDIIEDKINGLLTSPENYAEKILEFFKNEQLQEVISKQARIRVLESYSIDATYKVLKSSIEDALAV